MALYFIFAKTKSQIKKVSRFLLNPGIKLFVA